MRYAWFIHLLLLVGCSVDPQPPDGVLGFVEVNGQKVAIPEGVDPALMQQIAAELEYQLAQRQPSAPPTPQHMTPDTEVDGDDMWVYWEYGVTGDYDQNGEVNVSDITPIVIDFQVSDADANWDNRRMADGNGEVNLSDITPIVINFGDTFSEYILVSAPGRAAANSPSFAGRTQFQTRLAAGLTPVTITN